MQIASHPPPRLREHCPGAPPGLEAAIMRALAKRREDRFPDLACFARAIAPFGGPGAAASARNVARVLGGPASSRRGAPRAGEAAGEPARSGPRSVVMPPRPRSAANPRAGGTPRAELVGAALGALLVSAALLAGIGGIGLLLEPPPAAEHGLARAARHAAARTPIPAPPARPSLAPEPSTQSPEQPPPRPPPPRYGARPPAPPAQRPSGVRPEKRPPPPPLQRPPARTPRAVFGGR
jgi:serine/threonine-protein kinase